MSFVSYHELKKKNHLHVVVKETKCFILNAFTLSTTTSGSNTRVRSLYSKPTAALFILECRINIDTRFI